MVEVAGNDGTIKATGISTRTFKICNPMRRQICKDGLMINLFNFVRAKELGCLSRSGPGLRVDSDDDIW